jgi:peptidoglycan/xylan/chitin deacetylase (PgdA/CDA1 family)
MKHEILDHAKIREFLGRKRFLCRVPTLEKRVAITFDDGPHPVHTAEILDMCARKGIRATFFVVGRRVRRFPEIAARIAAEGHDIGNHTDRHLPLSIFPPAVIRRELAVTHELVFRATGKHPAFFRPPMGWFNDIVVREAVRMGYRPVIGSIHPHDSRKPGADEIVRHVLGRIEPGAIIILHDGGWRVDADRSQTVRAAERITSELLEQGYRFEALSELAGSGENAAAQTGKDKVGTAVGDGEHRAGDGEGRAGGVGSTSETAGPERDSSPART